jgi:hypothetical protein
MGIHCRIIKRNDARGSDRERADAKNGDINRELSPVRKQIFYICPKGIRNSNLLY